VFTEDVECVFQTGSRQRCDNVREFMGGILANLTSTQHNLTSSTVSETSDGAAATTYLVVQHVRDSAEGGTTYAMGGTYHDRLRHEPDGWRIYRRELVGSWRSGNPDVLIRP
jgi:3-phenylpropionate/cinnamic acid dioxygenase small subunit